MAKSGISGGERKNSEVGGEVENCEMEDTEVGENKTEENDTEESDHLEDCNEMLEITVIFLVKVTTLTTNTLRPPAFTNCTHPDHRSQEGLFKGQNRPR